MSYMVKPKKSLGQHFLTDLSIAEAIADTLASYKGLQAMLAPDADSLGVGVTVEQGVTYCYLLLGDPTTNNPYG